MCIILVLMHPRCRVNAWLSGSRATIEEFMGVHISMTGRDDKLGSRQPSMLRAVAFIGQLISFHGITR